MNHLLFFCNVNLSAAAPTVDMLQQLLLLLIIKTYSWKKKQQYYVCSACIKSHKMLITL